MVVSLLAGAYPAVFLSRFQPVAVLRRRVGGSWRSGVRSLLVVTQFAISIVLIIGMGVVLRQVSYVQNKDLGFEKDHLVVLPVATEMQTRTSGRSTRPTEESGGSSHTSRSSR